MSRKTGPTYHLEAALIEQGYALVAGLDEAGRGSIAGPVTAGVAILPPNLGGPGVGLVRDSKQLTPARREQALLYLEGAALALGVGMSAPQEVDAVGIVQATRLAMKRALSSIPLVPAYLLLDAFPLPGVAIPQKSIIRGDALCLSIAAASIVAKVARDRHMAEQDAAFPGYGFARHKGYGTREHLRSLQELGACEIHRRTFAPVKLMVSPGEPNKKTQRQGLGRLGEELAKRHLETGGHTILETNYRTTSGEIDLVTKKDGLLAFVEVRTKRGSLFGSPEESVTPRKRARMVACAEEYIDASYSKPREWRIDVVAIELDRRGRLLRLDVLENAVEL